MTNTTATATSPAVAPLHAILARARMATCGHCRAEPDMPCAQSPAGAPGVHVARLGRAFRLGLVSGPELIAVLQTLVVFDTATVVYDAVPAAVPA